MCVIIGSPSSTPFTGSDGAQAARIIPQRLSSDVLLCSEPVILLTSVCVWQLALQCNAGFQETCLTARMVLRRAGAVRRTVIDVATKSQPHCRTLLSVEKSMTEGDKNETIENLFAHIPLEALA